MARIWYGNPDRGKAGRGQASARMLWLRAAATVSGPRNSIATDVPSGMRSIAARNATV
jgi:hypothetical protein